MYSSCPRGRVHAIGAGCFIAEIQQTSNITYRIYDYDRKGPDGKGRELHTELAKDAIDYTLYPDYRTHYKAHTNATVELAACKYFTTNLLDVDTIMVVISPNWILSSFIFVWRVKLLSVTIKAMKFIFTKDKRS